MSLRPRQTHRLLVIQRPALWLFSLALLTAVLLLALWGAFEYGRLHAVANGAETRDYITTLEDEIASLRRQIVEYQRQTTMLERNRQIDEDAADQLKATLLEAQTEVVALKKQLGFYKSVVSPESGERSLQVQRIRFTADPDGGYRYKIMLSQHGRNDRLVRGTLAVSLKGRQKGKSVQLKLGELSAEMKQPARFGFKYFQNFEGRLDFPEGFEPQGVNVLVKPKTKKIKALDEHYSWTEILSGGA